MCELIAIAQNKFKESKMINKKRTPVFDKKKLPTATKTPQENAQTNNSITKIEQS